MTELSHICSALDAGSEQPDPFWLATVIGIEGSAYRRPGARMLFSSQGVLAGGISGGCLERELMRTSPWLARQGPVVQAYDARGDDDSETFLRTGCDGRVSIMIEEVTTALAQLLKVGGAELEQQRRVVLATVTRSLSPCVRVGDRLLHSAVQTLSQIADVALGREISAAAAAALSSERPGSMQVVQDSIEVLLEVIEPGPQLFVFGAGADAVPVVRTASLLGWPSTVCTTVSHFSIYDRFARLARVEASPIASCITVLEASARPVAVVMSHNYERDSEALGALMETRVRYIGMLGPARRTERMLDDLQTQRGNYAKQQLARVHGPAGLHVGAETAEEIALSIVAEAQAVLACGNGGFLRNRRRTIHEQIPKLHILRAERE